LSEHKALSGKVSIVTGASSGIGRVIARRLSGHGCRIVLASRSHTELKSLQREISDDGGQAVAVQTDLSKYEDLDQLVHATLEEYETIDFLVNNAGWGRKAVVTKARIEDWEVIGRVHGEYFADIRPAATMVQVTQMVDPDWFVEIEADAYVET